MVKVSEILTCGIILFLGYFFNLLLNKIHVPGLVGMMIIGIFIGPEFLNIISEGILNISSELRTMALIIILAQSGLHLDLQSLKKVGRPAILLSFLPATFEIIGAMIAGHFLLDFTYPEGLALGAILGSASPAIISARMIKLIELKIGETHSIPKLLLAGASWNDIYCIILFYAFLSIVGSSKLDWKVIVLGLPISIISGVFLGILVGYLIVLFFKKTSFNLPANLLVVFSVSMLLEGLESLIDEAKENTSWEFVSVSGLLGVIVNGIYILHKLPEKAKELSEGFTAIWRFFEIILFVLVGASLEFDEDFKNDLGYGLLVLLISLVFRSIGTYLSLIKTEVTNKEKIYIIVTFISKATVQASIGGVALSRGYDCGKTLLTVSIISIIATAPFGSAWMEYMAPRLLESEPENGKGQKVYIQENNEIQENRNGGEPQIYTKNKDDNSSSQKGELSPEQTGREEIKILSEQEKSDKTGKNEKNLIELVPVERKKDGRNNSSGSEVDDKLED